MGEEYILKTESDAEYSSNRDSMLKNINIAKALSEQGFAASLPIPTKFGSEYLDSEKIAILTRGIKGTPLPKEDRFGDKRREISFKYGESIARLHNALAAIEPDIRPQEQNLYTHVTEWALPEIKKQNYQYQMGLSDSFFENYIDNFGVLFDKLPKQLIHRDPNPSNILFDGGEVSGFIDFDLSERNVRLWDLCYCSTGILCEWCGVDGIHEEWLEILEGVLQGYDRVNPLTAEEKQAVYYVICSIQMICVAYFESVSDLKELAKTNREMLQFIIQNKEFIQKVFG